MTESIANVANHEASETFLSLWTALEASLQSSQRALLDRDLNLLEAATAEQSRLLRAIHAGGIGESQPIRKANESLPVDTALLSIQRRVQSLAKIQQALLERAQRSLQMLSHLVAGPQAPYATVPGRPGVSVHAATAKRGGFWSEEA